MSRIKKFESKKLQYRGGTIAESFLPKIRDIGKFGDIGTFGDVGTKVNFFIQKNSITRLRSK